MYFNEIFLGVTLGTTLAWMVKYLLDKLEKYTKYNDESKKYAKNRERTILEILKVYQE